jgi:hypothetical protein
LNAKSTSAIAEKLMPVEVWIVYLGYVGHTSLYIYNRRSGKSAQFGVTRIEPDSPKALKVFVDLCVGVTLVAFSLVVLRKLLMPMG